MIQVKKIDGNKIETTLDGSNKEIKFELITLAAALQRSGFPTSEAIAAFLGGFEFNEWQEQRYPDDMN